MKLLLPLLELCMKKSLAAEAVLLFCVSLYQCKTYVLNSSDFHHLVV